MPVVDRITKAFVEQVPFAEKGQIIYSDRELPGFQLISGTGTKTYAAQKDIQGRSVRYTIGRHGHFTPEEARKIAREKLFQMSCGINPNRKEAQERAQAITVATALDSYLATRKNLKPRTRQDYRYYVEFYLADWTGKLMTDITKEMIAARHQKIAEDHGPVCANKAMRVMRALFFHVNATFDICPVNPVLYLTRVKGWYAEKPKRTYIKPQDLPKWWKAVHELENDVYRDFMLVLLFTGLRRSEASRMAWSEIHLESKTFTIPDTKNGEPLVLPMSDFLYQLFLRRYESRGDSEYVFPGPGATGHLAEPKKGVAKVAKAIGLHHSPHDLRRSFCTYAESLEISHYALKRLMNHKLQDVTGGHYIVMDVERLRGPVQKIADFILEQVKDESIRRVG